MRKMIMLGLAAALAFPGCTGGTAGPVTAAVAGPRVLTVAGTRFELAVQASFPGTADRVGPVLWVQVKVRNLADRRLDLPVKLPYELVDAAGHPAPEPDLVTSQVHLGFDAEHPALPVGPELTPGETVVGFLAFSPPGAGFTPAAFRFDLDGPTDWPLAGLPDQPVIEALPPPAGAVEAGQTVPLTGSGPAGSAAGPLVDASVRVRFGQLTDARSADRMPAGYHGVAAPVEITNVGQHPYRTSTAGLYVFDTAGRAYRSVPLQLAGALAEDQPVPPGRTVHGLVAFAVPDRATLSHIRFALPAGNTHSTAWWTI